MDRSDDLIGRARCYDEVAEIYERVNAPLLFDAPARELVSIVAPPAGARVLDVGAGTGAVSRHASRAVGHSGCVVSVDPSLPMLRAAIRGGAENAVVGVLPELPFVRASFDVVLSAFVLTHVDDTGACVADIARVLRPGGRVGLSAWGPTDDEPGRAWADVAHAFVSAEPLADAVARVMPGEPVLSTPDGLREVLERGGFQAVTSCTRAVGFELTVESFVRTREVSATGRALRLFVGESEWPRFHALAMVELTRRFPSGVAISRAVNYAAARRGI